MNDSRNKVVRSIVEAMYTLGLNDEQSKILTDNGFSVKNGTIQSTDENIDFDQNIWTGNIDVSVHISHAEASDISALADKLKSISEVVTQVNAAKSADDNSKDLYD